MANSILEQRNTSAFHLQVYGQFLHWAFLVIEKLCLLASTCASLMVPLSVQDPKNHRSEQIRSWGSGREISEDCRDAIDRGERPCPDHCI